MYPRLIIDKEKYRHNVKAIQALSRSHGLSLMAVTKSFCADVQLVEVLKEEYVDFIADSRIDNLKNIDSTIPKVLLRLVSLYEIEDVVMYADISLNSEIEVIKQINTIAKQKNVTHSIILMVDVGDLREGVYYKENLLPIIDEIEAFENVNLLGLGTNLTCYGGIIPTQKTLSKLVKLVESIESHLQRSLTLISGGNSSHLYLLYKDTYIPKINNIRVGEALILGRETAFGERLIDLYDDVVTLEVDLIEVQHKPSVPEGEIGMDAFGKVPDIKDYGHMKRGILSLGKQDVDFHELICTDSSIQLIGSSSDHILVNLTHAKTAYKVGDIITFKLSYGSLLSLMTSKYVRRFYV